MGKVTIAVESGNRTDEQLERWVKSIIRKATPTDVAVYVVPSKP